jgi:imidazolonepropionase-like amidohydrolase
MSKSIFIAVLLLATIATSAAAQSPSEVVCSYAPSQSNAVAVISGAAGGASATIGAVSAATGLTVVTHSSGALILTGASGYIAGTIGTIATAPAIFTVGLIVGGAAVTLEVVCASNNHPDQVKKVHKAAEEFSRRFGDKIKKVKIAGEDIKKSVSPATGLATVKVKRVAKNIWQYAYRNSPKVENI